jgi:hypothetical protein
LRQPLGFERHGDHGSDSIPRRATGRVFDTEKRRDLTGDCVSE